MNIENAMSKILNPLEKHAGLMGVGATLLIPNQVNAWKEDIEQILLGNIHGPEVTNILNWAATDGNVKMAAAAAIGGYVLKGATGNRTLNQIAEIASGAGKGALIALVSQAVLFYCTHSPLKHSDGTVTESSNTYPSGYGY